MFMKASGSTTRLLVMEFISIPVVVNMKEIGKMIFSMDSVEKFGKTVLFIRVNTFKVKSRDLGLTSGQMAHNILDNGSKIT